MMVTAVLSVVAVREPDPVEYVDIECQPAAISVDCNNVQMVPLKLKALHRSGADAALLDVFWRLHQLNIKNILRVISFSLTGSSLIIINQIDAVP